MNFYSLSDNSYGTKGVVWMESPLISGLVRKTCPTCENSYKLPIRQIPLNPVLGRGTFWQDSLHVDGGIRGLYISEKVKRDWDQAGLKYGKAWEAKVVEPFPKKLQGTKPPLYYWIQAPRGVELDYVASGYTDIKMCPKCSNVKASTPLVSQPHVFIPDTWDGSDVFGYVESSSWLFCTQRVLDLAIEKRWTNFEFIPINTPPPAQPIPYLKFSKK